MQAAFFCMLLFGVGVGQVNLEGGVAMEDQKQISEPCAGVPALRSQGLCPVDPSETKANKIIKKKLPPRNVRFVMKLLPEEYKLICARADRAELTPTEYARAKALDVSRTTDDRAPSTNRRELSRAVSEIGEATRPLYRIAEAIEVGESGLPKHRLELALTRLETATDAMLRALGVDIP